MKTISLCPDIQTPWEKSGLSAQEYFNRSATRLECILREPTPEETANEIINAIQEIIWEKP